MMELSTAILGILDRQQMTGYELKGVFSEHDFLPWSGNNNHIYTALVSLEKDGLVEKETVLQEKLPPQKRYSVTPKGRETLRLALQQPSDAPGAANDFLLHLAWSECLTKEELTMMLDCYQLLVEMELMIAQEKARRADANEYSSGREKFLWGMVMQNRAAHLQCELNWLAKLRNGLANK